ncbi:phage portal protein [Streptomyces sp. INA 01156]
MGPGRDEAQPARRRPGGPLRESLSTGGRSVLGSGELHPDPGRDQQDGHGCAHRIRVRGLPQRFVTGLEIQEDANGNPVEPFNVGQDKLLQAEAPDAKFGSFEVADLKNYVVLVDMLVQHLASVSRVPSHYFLVNSSNTPSGEAILSAEAGLVAKVKERMLHFGEAWERVIRLCFAVKRDKRKDAFEMETRWRDPEYRTEAQHVDALLKLHQLNVPEEVLWSEAGFSAAQIDAFREMRKADAKAAAEIQKLMPSPNPRTLRSSLHKGTPVTLTGRFTRLSNRPAEMA